MQDLFSFALSISGFAVLIWLAVWRGRIVTAFGSPEVATALIAFAIAANLAPLAGERRSSPVIGLTILALLAWAVVEWFRLGRRLTIGPADKPMRWAWLMMGALLVWCVAVDAVVAPGIYGNRPVAYVSAGLLWLAIGLIASRTTISMLAMAYTGLAVLAVLSLPALFSAGTWRACTTGALEKCSVADGLYKSIYDSENYIALVASITLIACLCAMRRFALLAAGSFCLLIIMATGSRTGLLAVAAAAAWRLGAFLLERRKQFSRIPWFIAIGLPAAGAIVAAYVMYTANRKTLSNRGNIWKIAREYLDDRLFTGVGVSKWYLLREAGEAPTHFFHSGYVLVIFSGGLIGLAMWTAWGAALLRGIARDGQAFTAKAPMILFLVYSLTEVVWNPLSTDGLSWIIIALMLVQSTKPVAQMGVVRPWRHDPANPLNTRPSHPPSEPPT